MGEDRSDTVTTEAADSPLHYFVYTGWIIGVMLLVTLILRIQLGDAGWAFLRQLVAIGITTAIFILYELLHRLRFWPRFRPEVEARIVNTTGESGAFRVRPWTWLDSRLRFSARDRARISGKEYSVETWSPRNLFVRLGLIVYVATAASLIFLDHRAFIVGIGLLEALAIGSLRPDVGRGARAWVAFLAVGSWVLAAGLPYTHISDWLMNAAPSSGLSDAAFLVAFGLVLVELSRERSVRSSLRTSIAVSIVALLLFAAFAFRTDHMLTEWVPIHRSYFADVSQSVRDGHLLLWDVPSLYGFLSMLTLAVIPASNGWQAVYELTGLFLVVEAAIAFVILRWGRGGIVNSCFAILLPFATIFGDSIARFPWSARLYPQGGLRLVWVALLLFVIFLDYVWREKQGRAAMLRVVGHVVWITSLLWSLEAGLWATAIWLPYLLIGSFARQANAFRPLRIVRQCLKDCWPLFVLPLVAVCVIDAVYRIRFGILPDWRAYLEFTGLFTSGKIRAIFWVQPYGAAWIIMLVLGALGTLGLLAVKEKRWPLLQLLAAAWLAVWATSSYFALEPLDFYIVLLMGVLTPAIAIAVFASRELPASALTLVTRLSIAPIAIIAIAISLGEPGRIATMKFPFTPGWNADITQMMPPISGELAQLMQRADISPTDRVLIPTGDYWTELKQGLILPFGRRADGKIALYHSWLPSSPAGPELLFNGLDPVRQRTYVNRYLDRTRRAGWYITYRKAALCSELSPRLKTLRSYASPNFKISLCRLKT